LYSLIVTAKMNNIDPQARLADVLARIAEHPVHRLEELLPWELAHVQRAGKSGHPPINRRNQSTIFSIFLYQHAGRLSWCD
jgi:hypothetical protein